MEVVSRVKSANRHIMPSIELSVGSPDSPSGSQQPRCACQRHDVDYIHDKMIEIFVAFMLWA